MLVIAVCFYVDVCECVFMLMCVTFLARPMIPKL